MARPMKPLVRGGGYYPSNRWIPLVYPGGYTTMNSGGEPTPSVVWVTVSGASPLSLVNAAASNIRSLTQTGKCVQSGTPTPDAPIDIVCNNGKLTKSANLVNINGQTPVNLAYSGNKLVTNAERYGYYIRVKPSTKYTISMNRDKTGAFLNICDTTSVPANNVLVQAYNTMNGTTASKTIMTKANTNYLYVYTAYTSGYHPFGQGDFQIEEGETASPYHPFVYADGTPEVLSVTASGAATQTVTDIPMLLSVGDYKDEYEIISGIKTGKVGVKVFDGTETATLQSINSYGIANFYIGISNKVPNVAALLCTHFKLQTSSISETRTDGILNGATGVYFRVNSATASTPQELSALFAAQYAAGTPVIVLYPIANETTEQTTPQPLRTEAGDNTVSVVSEVDPVELSVEYAQPESGGS